MQTILQKRLTAAFSYLYALETYVSACEAEDRIASQIAELDSDGRNPDLGMILRALQHKKAQELVDRTWQIVQEARNSLIVIM